LRRRLKPWLLPGGAVILLLALAAVVLVHRAARHTTVSPPPAALAVLPPPQRPPAPSTGFADFVGADSCKGCHPAEYDAWAHSTHGRAGGAPTRERVLAPFGGQAIRFRDATVQPLVTASGAFEFQVRQPGRGVTVLRVDGVVGGGFMKGGGTQGFLSLAQDGTLRFLPFDYSRPLHAWFCNTQGRANQGYVPISDTLSIATCTDWPPARAFGTTTRFDDCQQCHGSQIWVNWDTSAHRYDTRLSSLAVDCESCHGPGRRHVQLARAGRVDSSADIGMPALDTLSKDASIGVCLRCHGLKDALAPGFLPGRSFTSYYALKFPILGDRPYRVDGRVRTFAYQATQLFSDCYLNGSMTCVDCHDPHSQTYRNVSGSPLPGRFDNGQCLDCHPSEGRPLEAHTHHPAGSPGSRCVACHMPYLQQPELGDAVPYARSDHTIPIPRPGFDDSLGVTNACTLCHRDRSTAALQDTVARWYGQLKPHKPIITALFRAAGVQSSEQAAPLLLRPAARFPMAQFEGLADFFQRFVRPDAGFSPDAVRRLEALAGEPDVDVRSLALAALHLGQGDDPAVRRFLVGSLQALGAVEDQAVRRRWTVALSYLADRFAAEGDAPSAERAYDRALAVLPEDPRLLLHLGLVDAGAGQLEPAIAAFRRSLAVDSLQPLTLVNLGNALSASGDADAAVAAYGRALHINPHEALAYFDLANVYLRDNDPGRAAPLYRQAVENDPSLAPASFYLARALMLTGRLQDALGAVRQGLEFSPGDTTGLAMRRDLERSLGRH
jgi:tetratricopeptide (TPR) repeat protein